MQKISSGQICLLVGLAMLLVGFIIYRAVKYGGPIQEEEEIKIEETPDADSEYEDVDLDELSPAKLMMFKRSLDMCIKRSASLTVELRTKCMRTTDKLKQHGYSYNPTTKQIKKI